MDEWTAKPHLPPSRRLPDLVAASQTCTGCPLYADATQTVFGAGPVGAPLMLVGEQPGDMEDRRGEPFVGPAGRVLWKCLADAGLERTDVYTTNAVKHFKHQERGKRRLHKKPNSAEVEACHPWLDAEVEAVDPAVIVALGATAAQALLRRRVGIGVSRGTPFEIYDRPAFVTYHPSAALRATDDATRIRDALVADLRAAVAAAD